MKPHTKKTAFLNRALEDLDAIEFDASDERYKRQQKKLLKRTRNKHERNFYKRELRERED